MFGALRFRVPGLLESYFNKPGLGFELLSLWFRV